MSDGGRWVIRGLLQWVAVESLKTAAVRFLNQNNNNGGLIFGNIPKELPIQEQ